MPNGIGRGFGNVEAAMKMSDAEYWRERYERAASERDEAERRLRELAHHTLMWARSEHGATEVLMAAYRKAFELNEHPSRHMPRVDGCVYYVNQAEGRIKIGWTSSFLARMKGLNLRPESVLAVEEGGRALEALRHQRFAALRIQGTELFVPDEELRRHVAELAEASPMTPWALGVALTSQAHADAPDAASLRSC